MSNAQNPEDSDEEGGDTTENSGRPYMNEVGVTYECLASTIDTRIGYLMAVKDMLSDDEDSNKRAWHEGAIRELDLLRQEFTDSGNYFLHRDDSFDDDEGDDGNEDGEPIRPAPKDIPFDKKPSAIPDGFKLPKKGHP